MLHSNNKTGLYHEYDYSHVAFLTFFQEVTSRAFAQTLLCVYVIFLSGVMNTEVIENDYHRRHFTGVPEVFSSKIGMYYSGVLLILKCFCVAMMPRFFFPH